MLILASFIAGLTFGLGLLLSGMANPEKVLGFLDLTGQWDPSLALVMAGAIGVGVVAFNVANRRKLTLLGRDLALPKAKHLDLRLIIGSVTFGAGWGVAGFCPGPALVAVGAGETKAIVFVLAMIGGMAAFEVIEKLRASNA